MIENYKRIIKEACYKIEKDSNYNQAIILYDQAMKLDE